jgi:hypothetical protein
VLTSTKIVLLGLTAYMSASAFTASADKPESAIINKPVECTSALTLVKTLRNAGFQPLISNVAIDEDGKPEGAIQTWVAEDGKWAVIELADENVACLLGAGEKTIVHKRGISV